MGSAKIQSAIKVARKLLQGAQQQQIHIVTIGCEDEEPTPPEMGFMWIIQYGDGDASAEVARQQWRESLFSDSD